MTVPGMARGLSAKALSLLSGAAVGIVVGVIAAVLAVVRPAFLERIEASTYDGRARAVMRAAKFPSLAVWVRQDA